MGLKDQHQHEANFTALLDPSLVEKIPREELPHLLLRVSAFLTALSAKMSAPGKFSPPEEAKDDVLIDVKEASRRLAVSRDFLYRNKNLPFRVDLGPRRLRFSLKGLERYIRQRQGR